MAKKNLKKGVFITFEGPEGCGKSTQAKLLYGYLKKRSYDCVYTREPGGTKVGDHLRHILLHTKEMDISDVTELFLFEANRSQLVCELIMPSLEKNRIVICDRFSDATLSYQGYGSGISLNAIKVIDYIATGGITPDLTILLDIDATTGLKRARRKGSDRFEAKDIAYHRRVRRGYLELAARFPNRIKVIRVNGTISQTQSFVRREVAFVIQRYKRSR